MRKNILKLSGTAMYLIAALLVAVYAVLGFDRMIMIHPVVRLMILALICLSSYFAGRLISLTVEEKYGSRIMRYTFVFFFILYILLIINFMLFDSFYGRANTVRFLNWNKETFSFYIKESLNLIPFKTVFIFVKGFFDGSIRKDVALVNLLGNLFAFVPLAFFLPLLFKKLKSFKRFIITVMLIVAAVEFIQLLMLTGSFDVDDFILNVGGAALGYKLFHLPTANRLINKITKLQY